MLCCPRPYRHIGHLNDPRPYGQDTMLPMEVLVRSARRALQNYLESANYNEAMIARLEEFDVVRLSALDYLFVQKN